VLEKKKRMFKKIGKLCKESYNELKNKVSWPTTKELTNSAVIVLIASVIMSLVIGLVDLGFEHMMKFIYSLIS
jgi:preprotein translocase subunit SecE